MGTQSVAIEVDLKLVCVGAKGRSPADTHRRRQAYSLLVELDGPRGARRQFMVLLVVCRQLQEVVTLQVLRNGKELLLLMVDVHCVD